MVDSEGSTLYFYLSKLRYHKAAQHFFLKALRFFHVFKPCVITVDKNPAYPITIEELKKEKRCLQASKLVCLTNCSHFLCSCLRRNFYDDGTFF
uniref:DDE-type integrase/transposase/recombinase n=1 Tax=Bacillus cereus TaxID=1396 RepID=UPI0037094C16